MWLADLVACLLAKKSEFEHNSLNKQIVFKE